MTSAASVAAAGGRTSSTIAGRVTTANFVTISVVHKTIGTTTNAAAAAAVVVVVVVVAPISSVKRSRRCRGVGVPRLKVLVGVVTLGPSLSLGSGLRLEVGLGLWAQRLRKLYLRVVLVLQFLGVLDVGFFSMPAWIVLGLVWIVLRWMVLVLSKKKQVFLLFVESGFCRVAPA
jgi:hypothetical protein